jgi:transposase
MEMVYERCCGVDVHKKMIVACFRRGKQQESRTFSTISRDLRVMAKWLTDGGCQMVAMESTGSYWKPVYNILELLGLEAIVVNAHHMKAVPGRKTDTKDAAWIADLLQHGLLKPSYVPDKEQRELREVVRYRKSLVEERAREKNRLEKTLEGANIKLSSFVSELTGLSSRNLLKAAIDGGVTDDNIDGLLYGKVAFKRAEILKAMDGFLTPVQKRLIAAMLNHIDDMTSRILDIDNIVNDQMQKYEKAIQALDQIPGIGTQSAQVILAEIGLDMSRFPSAAHLASWAGISPGNNQSAGKNRNSRTCKGNATLKTTLVQCAKACVKHKDSFFRAQYDRLVVRRGANRATVAVAHSILIAIYNMLAYDKPFFDLGKDYYNRFNTEKKIHHYLKKLSDLGVALPLTAQL